MYRELFIEAIGAEAAYSRWAEARKIDVELPSVLAAPQGDPSKWVGSVGRVRWEELPAPAPMEGVDVNVPDLRALLPIDPGANLSELIERISRGDIPDRYQEFFDEAGSDRDADAPGPSGGVAPQNW